MHRLFLLFVLLLFAAPLAASCAETSEPFIHVVTESWPPYNYQIEGDVTGISTDMVRAVLERAKLPYSIDILPWPRAYKTAQERKNVLIYTILKLDQRAKLFKWVRLGDLRGEMHLFRPAHRRDITLEKLDDARPYHIGLTRDTAPHHYLRERGFSEDDNFFFIHNPEQLYRLSCEQYHRVDLTAGDGFNIAHSHQMLGLPTDHWVPELFLTAEDFYLAFSRSTDDAVVRRVQTAMDELQAEGVLSEIIMAYRIRLGILSQPD